MYSAVLVISYCHMLQKWQSQGCSLYMHCDVVIEFVICISNKINYLEVQFCMNKIEREKQFVMKTQYLDGLNLYISVRWDSRTELNF